MFRQRRFWLIEKSQAAAWKEHVPFVLGWGKGLPPQPESPFNSLRRWHWKPSSEIPSSAPPPSTWGLSPRQTSQHPPLLPDLAWKGLAWMGVSQCFQERKKQSVVSTLWAIDARCLQEKEIRAQTWDVFLMSPIPLHLDWVTFSIPRVLYLGYRLVL